MGAHSARRESGEPSPDLARSMVRLHSSCEKLRTTASQLSQTADNSDGAVATWFESAAYLFELNSSILEEASIMRFTGAVVERLTIRGRQGVPISADAGYISVLSRRMDRHSRIGRLLLTSEPRLEPIGA